MVYDHRRAQARPNPGKSSVDGPRTEVGDPPFMWSAPADTISWRAF